MEYQKIEKIKQKNRQREDEHRHREDEHRHIDMQNKSKVSQPFIFGNDDYQNPYGKKQSKI